MNPFYPQQGCGVGLRSQHYPVITGEWPRMDWLEAISENYMDTGGRPLHILEKVRCHYPIALHGTSLSIGSADPIDPGYLVRLKKLVERIDPFIVSDHLCWCGVEGEALHDLLPLPFTEEAVRHVVSRVNQVQEFLGRKILLENVSTYVTYRHSAIPEWEFLTGVARRSGAGILLDLNNLYVNAFNHRFDPHEYLRNIPGELVGQFHLAGHTDRGKFLFDTHSDHVIEPVWDLYREALRLWGPVSTLIEWDESIPPFEVLSAEAEQARKIYQELKADLPRKSPLPSKKITTNQRGPLEISLPEVQRWFKAHIQPGERKQFATDPSKTLVNPQGGDPGEERMEVYGAGYLARIRETLSEVYEAVHSVLGDDRFSELAQAYAGRYPSRNYNLNYAGRHFPQFLENSPLTKTFPFLMDLARLEWLIWEAFHAFDRPPLNPSEWGHLAVEEWENVRIEFQPSVRLFDSGWPVLDLWKNRRQGPGEAKKLDRLSRAQRIFIGRKEDDVRCELLDENQYRLLAGLLAGETLGEVCARLADTLEEEMPPLSEWFSRWVQDGLVLDLKFRSPASL